MSERLCSWIQSIACYFVFQSALMHFLPDNSYKKYVQFYMGLLFIWILVVAGGRLLGAEEAFVKMPDFGFEEQNYKQSEWKQKAYEAEQRYWQEQEEVDEP